jgi:hypothetical protein
MGASLRRWPMLVAAVLLTVLGAVVNPTAAFACTCVAKSVSRAIRDADAVFRGTVTDRKGMRSGPDRWVDVRFSVSAVYKGTVYADQVVSTRTDSAACGLGAEVGSTWVIFALSTVEGTADDAVERLGTGLCSGNLPGNETPSALGRAHNPRPGPSDRLEQAVNADAALTRGVVIAGVSCLGAGLVLAGVLALAWRRRTT